MTMSEDRLSINNSTNTAENNTRTNKKFVFGNTLIGGNNDDTTRIFEGLDKATKKVDNFFVSIAEKQRTQPFRIPGIIIIIVVLMAYKAGVFDTVPGIKHLVAAFINLIDAIAELICRLLSKILQGPLVEIGDIMFPPVG